MAKPRKYSRKKDDNRDHMTDPDVHVTARAPYGKTYPHELVNDDVENQLDRDAEKEAETPRRTTSKSKSSIDDA